MSKLLKPVLVIVLLLCIGMGGYRFYQQYQMKKIMQEPVDNIFCEVNGGVEPGGSITSKILTVQAVSKSGLKYRVTNYGVSQTEAPEHGSSFEMTIEYRGIKKSATIPIEREPESAYKIGYPDQEAVVATVYKNGDLSFTGSGQTININGSNAPWKQQKYSYIEFDEDVAPESMDGWFSGNKELVECKKLPKSVKSLRGTFSGCTALEKTPEYFQCSYLSVMQETFSGCISLTDVDALPVNVIDASACFKGCAALKQGVDMTKTSVLERIDQLYADCVMFIDQTPIPQTVRFMKQTYANCQNLRNATAFPMAVEDISSCYEGCTSLESATTIPESIKDGSNCYASCPNLRGNLEINSDSSTVVGCLKNSVYTGNTLYLSGNSGRLIDIQSNTGNRNIILSDPEEAARQNQRMLTELEAGIS